MKESNELREAYSNGVLEGENRLLKKLIEQLLKIKLNNELEFLQ
jgi:hypothetical protein